MTRPLAVVTGASTGIGLELAAPASRTATTAIVCADEPVIEAAAAELAQGGRRWRQCKPISRPRRGSKP